VDYLDLTLPTLAANLALEEALLLEAEAGASGEVLRIWEWPAPAVILGAGCRLAADVNEGACLADGVPILRRSSGGGTVLLGPGCLVFSLVLAYDRSRALQAVSASYDYILDQIRRELEHLLAGIERAGISDLAVSGLKFSGNAQQRKRRYLLHHGTLLYDFKLDLVCRYLHIPERQPAYRMGRAHLAFLRNFPAAEAELKRLLQSSWNAASPAVVWPKELVHRLTEDKYRRHEWINRR
jgi:lipoate-protein ligase A